MRRLDSALHTADRRIGVATAGADGGARLIVLTDDADPERRPAHRRQRRSRSSGAASVRAGRETAEGVRYECPGCDVPTLAEAPPGTYEICDVCGWEDDSESLRQARAAFRSSGPG